MTRRQVGGYAWQDELERVKQLSEEMTHELVDLGRHARSVEAANRVMRLVSLAAQISVKAMELREYKGGASE